VTQKVAAVLMPIQPGKVQEIAQQVPSAPAKPRITMAQSTAVSSYVPRQITFNDNQNQTRTE